MQSVTMKFVLILLPLLLNAVDVIGLQTHGLNNLGCWADNVFVRALPSLEGTTKILDGVALTRSRAVQKCAEAAHAIGANIFAVQLGACYSSTVARDHYMKYGGSIGCLGNRRGGILSNQVYEIKWVAQIQYSSLGCWKDEAKRAIPSLEGLDPNLDGIATVRKDPIEKCAEAAYGRNYFTIGLQFGGQCYSSAVAQNTYKKYGKSTACDKNGEGGSWANNVYHISSSSFKYII